MCGYDMLYLPGMDHAGIATQAKVDERLKNEGISRYDIGREKFLERAWEWKEEYASTIRKQWAKLGNSLDYTRERFTMDEGFNKAVRHVFVSLYNEGLIYRGYRIINWDPEARTALSNIEVYYQDDPGKMYYFRYKVVENGEEFSVATTRPETMFGDVCIVVNPNDDRWKHLIGMHTINPANGKELPIIGDDYIDMDFGTAIMKCTPAHDPNDFAIAERHGLEKPICMNPDGTMNALCGKYEGMDRYAARDAVVAQIEEEGNLIKIEDITHNVGHSERTHCVVEPYLSEQWFVKMAPLAGPAIEAVEKGQIKFVPERFTKTYLNWMHGTRDWCISRQLWWGHRIPAWYCADCGATIVAKSAPASCPHCGGTQLDQDPDTLDTWFSSALWPFSTLGWPKQTEDYDYFYPTNALVTGYDIIGFWVSRMIFSGLAYTDKAPFDTVLIHGLVRDSQGRKMSKSLGNGIDPLEVIDQYGADALRMTLVVGSTAGNDMRYSEEKITASRNFANKLWNAARFVLMNLPESFEPGMPDESNLDMSDKWVLSELGSVAREVTANLDKYELGLAADKVEKFIWEIYCDWYIEICKSRLNSGDEAQADIARKVLVYVLDRALRLLHPFMPFITEEIYQALPGSAETIMTQEWPDAAKLPTWPEESADFEQLMDYIKAVRATRSDMNVPPSKKTSMVIETAAPAAFEKGSVYLARFAFATDVTLTQKYEGETAGMVTVVTPSARGFIPMMELIDRDKELARLQKELTKNEKEIAMFQKQLENPRFVEKAPAALVAETRSKLIAAQDKRKNLEQSLAALQN